MSSDSDFDEDELLQMALKEQSGRDVNYQKPSSNKSRKPVENYVQPPSQNQPKKSANNNKGARGRRDQDDDSDVEMLSISSGDDEPTGRDQHRAAGSRGRAGRASSGGRDDDDAWDGGEPDCWKRVDETEVQCLSQFPIFCPFSLGIIRCGFSWKIIVEFLILLSCAEDGIIIVFGLLETGVEIVLW